MVESLLTLEKEAAVCRRVTSRRIVSGLALMAIVGTSILAQSPSVATAAESPRGAPLFSSVYQGYGPTRIVGVACPSTTLCLAVGNRASYGMLYRSTDAGVTWTPEPEPGGSLDFSYDYGDTPLAISCGTPTFCVIEYATNIGDSLADEFIVSTDGGLTWSGGLPSLLSNYQDPTYAEDHSNLI